ncbi:MAG: metallophosphoesterase, partial [Bdellovibrionia bacterium]
LKFRSTKGEVDTGRRLFLTRSTSAAALFGAGGVGSYGINVAVSGPPVHDVEVALKKWPAELAGFRIAQISDLHVGPSIRLPYVQDVVTKINALDADLVVLTGDIVDGTIDFLREHVQPLSQLKAKHGVYMVTGNHEYYAGAVPWVEEFTRMGIRVLRNENLKIETGGQAFNLAGVDDYLSEGMAPGHGFDLEGTLRGRDPSLATVLLAHQPRGFIEAVSLGVDLQLSGHTHGGQIWPFALFISFVQPYVKGLHKLGDSHIYVSCGTGYWGPAMRVNAPSEITHFKLIPEKA